MSDYFARLESMRIVCVREEGPFGTKAEAAIALRRMRREADRNGEDLGSTNGFTYLLTHRRDALESEGGAG